MAFASRTALAEPIFVDGTVVDESSGKPIAGATVIAEQSGTIALTNEAGAFEISITARGKQDVELTATAEGYAPRTVRITKRKRLRIALEASAGAEVIEIHGKFEETKPLAYELTVDEIRMLPGAGNDVLRAAQALPGVARIPYAFGGLVLRGMSPRDTAVYLDGIEVPLAFHFGGVTSFYPSGMLADLSLTAGGFEAAYGRAQAGIVTLTTREPRTDKWRVGGSIGLLDSSVNAEGPMLGGGAIIGIRRSYFDTIAGPFVDDEIPLPSYWDAQLRTSFGDPRKRGRITPMIFLSIDRVANDTDGIREDKISLTSAFVRIAAPYTRTWGATTLHVVPWLGVNTLRFEVLDHGMTERFERPLYPGGVRVNLTKDYAWGHVRSGIDLEGGYLSQLQIGLEGDNGPTTLEGEATVAWTDLALWWEGRFKLDGDRFAVKPGVRAEAYGLSRELVIDPRINVHQKLTPTLTLRQSLGRFHQPPTPADVDEREGNPRLKASWVDQATLGIDTEFAGATMSLTAFHNYGELRGVRVRRPRLSGDDPPEPDFGGLGPTFELLLEKQLGFTIYRQNRGRARSYGLELLVKRKVRKWFGMIAYTLSRAERTDDPTVYQGWRPFELDQTHNLNIAVSRMLTNWRLGARVQLVSGNPYSPSKCQVLPGQVEIGCNPDPWAGVLPVFFQLDVRADRTWHRKWGDINLFFDIQNVTNRRNVEGRELEFDDNGMPHDADIPGLPIVPFIGVEFIPK